jgi:copper resistance protein B
VSLCSRSRLGALILACAVLFALTGVAGAQTTATPAAGSVAADMSKISMAAMDDPILAHVLFNQLEGRTDGSRAALRWDAQAWIGTDSNRLWLKSEGFADDGAVSDGDLEALYDRPLPRLRYFDGQVGVREDLDSGPRRTWGALGIEGLAPYFFQFEPTFYFRDGGHVAGRITASYDLRLTQRLVAQSELEMNFYSRSDPQRGLGTGLSDLDTGLRLRYEIVRKFAPYVGFAYTRKFGDTATLSRQIGESAAEPAFVFGLRLWK